MANDNVKFKVKIDADDKGVKQAAESVEDLKKGLDNVEQSAEKASGGLSGFAASTMALNALSDMLGKVNTQIQAAAASFDDFDGAMRAANTMMGLGEGEFQNMKDALSELSKEVPKTRKELAEGLYQVISNGVSDPVEAMKLLETSARASVGGIADLGQVVGVTATIWKNYGLDASAAADIQDKIQLTAKNGVTSFEQLAAALPAVSGNAATLGVSIDELLASFATLTGVSGNTAQVSTQLGAIFTAMVKPSSEAAKMAEKMGIKFDAATIQAAGGFEQFLSQLKVAVSEYSKSSGVLEQEVYGRLFGSAEAMKAIIPLQGELASKYSANVNEMANSAGTMDEAFSQMASTGNAARIMLQNAVQAATDWATGIASACAPTLEYVAALGDFGTSMGGLVSGGKMLYETLKNLNLGTKLASAAQAIYNAILTANPIGIVVMALAALGAAFVAAYNYCEPFRNAVNTLWALIKARLAPIFETLGKAVKKVWEYMVDLFGIDTTSTAKAETDAVNDEADAYDALVASMQKAGSIKADMAGGGKGKPSGSLAAIDDKIKGVKEQINIEVNPQSRAELYKQLQDLENQKLTIEAKMKLDAEGFNGEVAAMTDSTAGLQDALGSLSKGDDLATMNKKNSKAIKNTIKQNEKLLDNMENVKESNVTDNIMQTAGAFDQLGKAIGGSTGEIVSWAAQNVAALTQVIAQIITMITAKEAEGMASATASGSSLPFPANIAAIAAGVAAVVASFAQMPKFAAGGIISGPTIGLMGEYSGASNNPEVVAPLNRLKSMLGDTGGMNGRVEFDIKGRKLVGVLARENSFRSRQ